MSKIYVDYFFERYDCMKFSLKRTAYIMSFLTLASFFAFLYYAGYYYATHTLDSDNLITKEKAYEANPSINISQTAQVSDTDSAVVKKDTEYIEECYNTDTEEMTKNNTNVPVEFIGLTRDELIDYLTTYKENTVDKTLLNIQLVSFSEKTLVVRKTICNISQLYSYFIISENDVIKIYNTNKDTLLIDTGINIENFEEKYKEELETGFYVETIHDLYNYLESVTS